MSKLIVILSDSEKETPISRDFRQFCGTHFPRVSVQEQTYAAYDANKPRGALVFVQSFAPIRDFYRVARRLVTPHHPVFLLS